MLTNIGGVLFLGPFASPSILIGTVVVLLLVLVLGRGLIGLRLLGALRNGFTLS